MKFLCEQNAVPEAGAKSFEVEGCPLFLVKKFGEIHAYINSCPHIGVSLEWMPDQFLNASGEMIQCATHGALFVIDSGLCVAGPCIGESLTPLPIRIQEDGIYLCADA